MANPVSTIQSLKAVDAWIDVINANINGGVRTAFKASRLRFAGSNTQLDRAPTASALPLQFPEPSLITANTVIDFSQGAVTSSTEETHLAIQGKGMFCLSDTMQSDGFSPPTAKYYLTRDGEFHANAQGYLVNSDGLYLCRWVPVQTGWVTGGTAIGATTITITTTPANGAVRVGDTLNIASQTRTVTAVNGTTLTVDAPWTVATGAGTGVTVRASGVKVDGSTIVRNDVGTGASETAQYLSDFLTYGGTALADVTRNQQSLTYSRFGSTIFEFTGFLPQKAEQADATILSKSLEASNSSMTQSVPELSLAQKLFSALTKVLQIHQTNQDSVLNTIR